MKPVTEADIDRFVRAPDSLSDTERARIQAHLDTHPEARILAASIRDVYAAFDDLPDRASSRLEVLAHALQAPAHTIPLSPLRSTGRHGAHPEAEQPVVALAAATPPPPSRIYSVASLASSDERVLVRILHDTRLHRYLLAVISPDEQTHDHVVISFPELGIDLATSAEGQAVLDASEVDPTVWPGLYGMLRLPIARFELGVPGSLPHHVLLPEHAVECTPGPSGISMTVTPRHPGAPEVTLAVYTTPNDAAHVVRVDDGRGTLPRSVTLTSGTTRFYG